MMMSWWVYLLGSVLLGMASAVLAMLSLSASTAYGTEYHNMSPPQRVMARMLYLGSLAAAVICGLLALGLAAWSMKLLLS